MSATEFIEDIARGSGLWDTPTPLNVRSERGAEADAEEAVDADANLDPLPQAKDHLTSALFLEDLLTNG